MTSTDRGPGCAWSTLDRCSCSVVHISPRRPNRYRAPEVFVLSGFSSIAKHRQANGRGGGPGFTGRGSPPPLATRRRNDPAAARALCRRAPAECRQNAAQRAAPPDLPTCRARRAGRAQRCASPRCHRDSSPPARTVCPDWSWPAASAAPCDGPTPRARPVECATADHAHVVRPAGLRKISVAVWDRGELLTWRLDDMSPTLARCW
jgi:hypothetical protein